MLVISIKKRNIRNLLFLLTGFFISLGIVSAVWSIFPGNPFFKVSFFFLFLWGGSGFLPDRKGKIKYVYIFIIGIIDIALLVLINSFTFEYAMHIFVIIGSLFLLAECFKNNDESKARCLIKFLRIGCIFSIIFALSYYLSPVKYFYSTSSRTIGNINPQGVGVWAFLFSVIIVLTLDYYQSIIMKIFGYPLCFYLFLITLETESRASSLVLLLFYFFHFLPKLNIKSSPQMHLFISILIVFVPYLVYLVGEIIYSLGFFRDSLGGSLLNGREELWRNYLKEAYEHPLLGSVKTASVYTHNIIIENILVLGYPLTFSFFIFLVFVVYKQQRKVVTRIQYDAFIGFACVMLHSSMENSIIGIGVGGCYFYSYSFLLIASVTQFKKKNTRKINLSHLLKQKNLEQTTGSMQKS